MRIVRRRVVLEPALHINRLMCVRSVGGAERHSRNFEEESGLSTTFKRPVTRNRFLEISSFSPASPTFVPQCRLDGREAFALVLCIDSHAVFGLRCERWTEDSEKKAVRGLFASFYSQNVIAWTCPVCRPLDHPHPCERKRQAAGDTFERLFSHSTSSFSQRSHFVSNGPC